MEHALLTAAEMGQADRLTIERGTSAVQLMANAGRAVANEIMKRWSARSTLVLCGPGNNGGDGFVVASILAQAGWPVRVAMLGTRDRMTGSARHHADQWRGVIHPIDLQLLEQTDIVIDAVFGAGYHADRENPVAHVMKTINDRKLEMVAIDIPTGVDSDTGQCHGASNAKLTVTFFRKKPGHVLLPGRAICGEIVVCDIGIDDSVLESIKPTVFENHSSNWIEHFPRPKWSDNKYDRGHTLIVGGAAMTGAARLAAIAAARMGSGLVTIASPDSAFPIYAATMTSVLVKPFGHTLQPLLSDERITACLVGPGAGVQGTTQTQVLEVLAKERPTVLDADAISAFHESSDLLFNAIHGACVLTPHEGEFRRVFKFQEDRISRAINAAKQAKAVVLLKGADTVVAAQDGRVAISSNAPSTLATAGSGDVLSGILVGLLAQKMDPFLAACAATWIHAEAANHFGPGLIAEDLQSMLPSVLRSLTVGR
jgi:ADP-dependent NAD(P)H-hydrate dehydratase / NAD(P)H-hydrate epimerase